MFIILKEEKKDYMRTGLVEEYFKKSLQLNTRYCPSYLALTKLNKIDIGGNVYESIHNLLQENLSDLFAFNNAR